MLALEAATKPHIITRPCPTRADAEWWAKELIRRGFEPVTIDGMRFEPVDAEAQAA